LRRFGPALFGALAAALLLPAAALAHAQVVRLNPGPGLLNTVPGFVSIAFSEPVTPFGRGIDVFAPNGKLVSGMAARRGLDGTTLVTPIAGYQSLPEGTYLVEWRIVAQDTHPSRGSYTFSVGHPGPAPAGAAPAGDLGAVSPLGLLLQALARWLHFLGFALSFGVVAFQLLVLREARPRPRLLRLVQFGIGLLLAAEPIALVAQAASLGTVDSPALADVLGTAYGRVLALRIGAALLLWGLLGALREAGWKWAWSVPVLGIALALIDGLAGHTIRGAPALAAQLLTAVHIAAMVVWAGGLVALLAVIETTSDKSYLVGRFGRVAAASLVLLVLSGGLLALAHLRAPADLLLSGYGLTLALKLVAVAVALWLAWTGVRRLRSGQPELLALAGVLALAALLASLPPPR
jgi:copper transport protein